MTKQLTRKIHELMESALSSDDTLFDISEGIKNLAAYLGQFVEADERLQIEPIKSSLLLLGSALRDAQLVGNKPASERQDTDIPPIKNKVRYAVSRFEMWCKDIAPEILRQPV